MRYIVWTDNYTEGWGKSDEFSTMSEVFGYITSDFGRCGHPYFITKVVEVDLVEKAVL